ncbi:MAG: PBP1A family penicillin-binding protein [Pseudomonadota bacterium]
MFLRMIGTAFASVSVAAIFGVLGIIGLSQIYGGDLPDHDELVNYQPKLLSRVYSSDGSKIAEYATEQRVFVPIDEVPDLVKQAFISAEDKNFYGHPGIDVTGIAKAIGRFVQDRMAGRDSRIAGASTITQQVMKNFLLSPERTIERKMEEMILAVRIDGALSKDQILELYLNEIFFGARSYGVVAAARTYFDKRLDELEPAEAAYLAGLPKEPSNLHPIRDYDDAIGRRNYVLREMAENGYLDAEEAAAARETPLVTVLGDERPAEEEDEGLDVAGLGFFTSEVRRQVSVEFGRISLFEGGLTVRATVDPRLQKLAGKALRRGLEKYDRDQGLWQGPVARLPAPAAGVDWDRLLGQVEAARDIDDWRLALVLSVDEDAAQIGIEGRDDPVALELNGERWIRARMVEGERLGAPRQASDLWQPGDVIYVAPDASKEGDWDLRQLPEVQGAFMAMDPETGRVLALWGGFSFEQSVFNRATQARRQPGSSFKPFVYAAALDIGYTPATIVNDAPVAVRLNRNETWRPKNSDGRSYGPMPMRRGLELSRNLMTVRIAQQVGMDRVANYAERFGVYDDMPQHLAYALGAGETTLYDMVAAYGMFANGGKRVRPTVIDRIQDRRGSTVYRHDPRSCQGCTQSQLTPREEPREEVTQLNAYVQRVSQTGSVATMPVLFDERPQIMDPSTARQIVSMLEGVVNRGTANRTVGGTGLPLAGKTGTTNDARDAWFVGFSPNLVAGCFIGFDTPRSLGKRAYGGTLCGPVFKEFMTAALEGVENLGTFEVETYDSELITVKIDRETGERLPDDAVGPNVVTEVFRRGEEPLLFAEAQVLESDASLFGSDFIAGALPYSLEEDTDYGSGASGGSDTGGSDAPTRPRPPAGASLGTGTGGLY